MHYVESFYIECNTGIHVSRRNIQIYFPDVGCTLFVDKNILKLRSQREDLCKQLKINRDLIDKALNEFEAETKCTLESSFDKEKEVILDSKWPP
jgi:hypothetical protein